MKVTPSEAEEALAAIQVITQRTRRSIASSGAHISLIITGVVWLIGFICTQFLSGAIVAYVWIGLSILGSLLATFLNMRTGQRVRSPSAGATTRRIGMTWLLLAVYCLAAIAIAWPLDGKQLTAFIVLFVLIGWLTMGLQLSFTPIWPGLVVIALLLGGYFLLPEYFYLWVGLLGGGGMIALGLYIRSRW
jgi:hypothetical protein